MKNILLLLIVVFSTIISNGQKSIQYGKASFYADKFEGRITASGEKYWHSKLTAAHRTLPFGTKVKVTNMENNKSVIVRINDRGPYVDNRLIDLSKSAARKIDFINKGVTNVKIEVIGKNNTSSISNTKPTKNTQAIPTPATKATSGNYTTPEKFESKFYKLNIKSIKPLGYGVQIASYRELANLMDRVNKIQKQTNKQITIQVSSVNGNKVYRIIAGEFDNRIKAERYKDNIKTDFPGCFIFKF